MNINPKEIDCKDVGHDTSAIDWLKFVPKEICLIHLGYNLFNWHNTLSSSNDSTIKWFPYKRVNSNGLIFGFPIVDPFIGLVSYCLI